jgi:Chaperone of endosialidase
VNGAIACSEISIGGVNLTSTYVSGIANADNITGGIVKVNYGGTGLNNLNSNQLLVGNGEYPIIQSSGLTWDNTNARLGINSSSPKYSLDIREDININGSLYQNGKLLISNSNISCSNIDIRGNFNINNGKIIGTNNNVLISPLDDNPEKGIYTNKSLFVGYNLNDDGYKLKVDGNAFISGHITSLSDSRYKTNISVIENPNEKIKKLRGVYYNLINEQKKSMGLIAQEVEEVLPEVIYTNSDNTTKSIAYGNLIGLIIESIKDILNHLNL